MKYLLFVAFVVVFDKTYGQYPPDIWDYLDTDRLPGFEPGQNPFSTEKQKEDPDVFLGKFAEAARNKIGSDRYITNGRYKIGKKKDKCHLFVADVIKEGGGVVPQRYPIFQFKASPISAKIWQNKRSMILAVTGHYKQCDSDPAPGDVIACKGHVGIVTGDKKTTLADPEGNPRGIINETDWGFRRGQKATCWRYT